MWIGGTEGKNPIEEDMEKKLCESVGLVELAQRRINWRVFVNVAKKFCRK